MHRTAKAAGDPQRWRGALVVAVKKQGGLSLVGKRVQIYFLIANNHAINTNAGCRPYP